ncbi:hypothetical protein QTI66_38950 [Variovorax sp. J22R133]|uniref:hypothetical protein n=1 Tax=Variovorax brevis TaxID=3053503 RepID=UPI002577C7ED|nr:hypothetical protein [Variovorax sp. J22R133]MDM0118055.1 hypothetical protein [Variovorax sp. J22R133]
MDIEKSKPYQPEEAMVRSMREGTVAAWALLGRSPLRHADDGRQEQKFAYEYEAASML